MSITYAATAATKAIRRKAMKSAVDSISLGLNALTSAPESTATLNLFCTVKGLNMTEKKKEALLSNIKAEVKKVI